jgi:hypothetical protein
VAECRDQTGRLTAEIVHTPAGEFIGGPKLVRRPDPAWVWVLDPPAPDRSALLVVRPTRSE